MRCNTKRVKSILLLGLLMVLLGSNSVQTQTIQLKQRTYIQHNGEWFLNINGEIKNRVIPHSLIVRLKDRSDPRNFEFGKIGLSGIRVASKALFGKYYVLEVDSTQETVSTALTLADHVDFDFVEFDALIEFSDSIPNDTFYASDQWNLGRINMPKAWDISTGKSSIVVAIHDAGTEITHADLNRNIWENQAEVNGTTGVDDDGNGYVDDKYGWDFVQGDNDPTSTNFHGTAAAGIAAAQTNNSEGGSYIGVAGVAGGWSSTLGASLMSLRVGSPQPESDLAALAVTYAAENGARVINMSWGGQLEDADMIELRDAITSAVNDYECVVIASSGNDGGESRPNPIDFPARYSNTISCWCYCGR